MSADKKDRMRMRVLFAEKLATEVFSRVICEDWKHSATTSLTDEGANILIDYVYRISDHFIDRQQKVVDEYQLNEPNRVSPVIQAPQIKGMG